MNYRNARHIANGLIDCEIEHPIYGWIPFTCDPTDTGAAFDVVALYDAMVSDVNTAAYVQPTQAEINSAAEANTRTIRDSILTNVVDPIVSNPLRWADMAVEKQAEWAAYRRALLDISQQSGFPHDVVWPVAPT
jgi:hypothetical protein